MVDETACRIVGARRNLVVCRTKCGRSDEGVYGGIGDVLESLKTDQFGRAIPSFLIRDCNVVRFIPSLMAAPFGPPTIHSASLKARMICSRSACSKVAMPSEACNGTVTGTFNRPLNSAKRI